MTVTATGGCPPETTRSARMTVVTPDRADLLVEAFDGAPTSLSLSDVDGVLTYGNRRFWELFGHTPGTELRIADLTREADRSWTAGYLEQLVSGEMDRFQTVKRFVRADMSEFDADLTISAIRADGVCTGLVASIDPVGLRPKVDDTRIRKLLEHSAGTLTLIDGDGHVVETSGRYRATLGYPSEFWEQRTIFDVLVPEDADRVLAMRAEVVSEPGREVTGDFRVIGADRLIETLEVTATNLLHDPDVRGIVVTSRNVTKERADRRAVEAQADDAVAEAERRSHLLATVSHELRNPLHAMTGMAELLASDTNLTGEQRDLAVAIERQLVRLARVADDLLDTSRFDVGEFRLRPTEVDVRDLVDDVARTARSAAGDRLTVATQVADEVPFAVMADGARLQQVLGNLAGNAVKFTERGSVEVAVAVDRGDLVLTVTDTGPGIDAADRDRVFEAFETLPGAADRRGAGLGLAIVRRIVSAMSGEISLASEPGVGTTVEVRLPLDEIDVPAAADADGGAPQRSTGRVLVVEDTPVNQDLARAQLARLGYDCVIAGSAEDGLEALAEGTFDAVLMDHQLPGMNGREATIEIRRRGWTVPVIGVTASSTAADERLCLEAGMDAFLPKPVGLARLEAALHDTLDGAGTPEHDAEASGSTTEAVDEAVLDALVDELGDRGIVEQLVESFLAELDARSADVAGDDDTLAARQAHTLKSSAALLGATDLAAACAAAEHEASEREHIADLAQAARIGLERWTKRGSE